MLLGAGQGWLYTGDLIYRGRLMANFPSTDPAAYLPLPGGCGGAAPSGGSCPATTAWTAPRPWREMRDAFRSLRAQGRLRHGGGSFDFGDWSLAL